jgi:Flp pilus assembly protein CpaB
MKTNRPFRLIVVFSLLALIALLIMLYNQNLQKPAIQEPSKKQTESIESDSI